MNWFEEKKNLATAMLPPNPTDNYSVFIKNNIKTKIKADHDDFIPKYQTEGSACADLFVNLDNNFLSLLPNDSYLIDCGFSMELPIGYKACISARSGWASKGLIINNAPGQIDSDYRGRIKICVTNISDKVLVIENKDRIGQIWIEPVYFFQWEKSDILSDTPRQDGGFGSTGFKK